MLLPVQNVRQVIEVQAIFGLNKDHVFTAHAAGLQVVESRLDSESFMLLERRALEIEERRLVDFQPNAMTGSVDHDPLIVMGFLVIQT